MKPSSYSTDLFIRPTDRTIFDALYSSVPENSKMVRLGVLGPRNSGRKTLLKELLKRRGILPGRHYLLFGTQAIHEIRDACHDPLARSLMLLFMDRCLLNQLLAYIEFNQPQPSCLVAWDQDSDDEEYPAADFCLSTEINLFDAEESRELQTAMASHFLDGHPEAEKFLLEKLEAHDLYWFPRAFNAFRKTVELLSQRKEEVDFEHVFSYVDYAFQ